jgi:hypothetical protein
MQRAFPHLVIVVFALLTLLVVVEMVLHDPAPVDASCTPVNVLDYGAKADGTTDSTAAITAAVQAATAAGKSVYVPAGVYKVSSLSIADGAFIKGAGSSSTWLRGHVDFGSNQVIRDLKIGNKGNSAVQNRNGAHDTVFESCRFRGGGGPSDATAAVIFLGYRNAVQDVAFRNCRIERAFGVVTSWQQATNWANNNISIYARTAGPKRITFEGCHVGVSNGVATGSPRMGLEAYVYDGATQQWQDITLRGCTFEVMDSHGADFSDDHDSRANGVLIEDCLFKGAGKVPFLWGSNIDLEYPTGAVIRNNTIWPAREAGIQTTKRSEPFGPCGATITGNTIDWTVDNGIDPGAPMELQRDSSLTLSGNTIIR